MHDTQTLRDIAADRTRGIYFRIFAALFLTSAAELLHTGWAPALWLVVNTALQGLDLLVCRRVCRTPAALRPWAYKRFLAWNTLIIFSYSSLAVYFWLYGGEFGRCFAIVQSCAGLLQVALQTRGDRNLLVLSMIGHGWALVVLPSFLGLQEQGLAAVGLTLAGSALYLIRLGAAVRQTASERQELITAKRNAELERTFIDSIIENVPNLLFVVCAKTGRYVLINKTAEEATGQRREDMVGRPYEDFHAPTEAAQLRRLDAEAMVSDKPVPFENGRIESSDGAVRTLRGRRVCIRDEAGEPRYVISLSEDVTEIREAEAQVVRLAHYDSLTELPNRVLFRLRLDEAFNLATQNNGRAALHWIDLDRFKEVNDTLGHLVGDQLLMDVAERLQAAVRSTDTVARLGGDEFAIVQSQVQSVRDAEELASRVVKTLSEPFFLSGRQVTIGASVGIAFAPDDAQTIDELMMRADMALYRSKDAGRGGFTCFEREMDERRRARRTLEQDLRRAFTNNEFSIVYQPQLHMASGRIAGCEALLRWQVDGQWISPAEFIPVAEEIGLISQLGEWVLRRACAEAARWPAPMKVAVNISPAQFKDQDLIRTVIGALAHAGLNPDRLELEITESTLLHGSETNLKTLFRLRELGCSVALDDFGTGFSSLNYLRQFPFTKIKIDRSFVGDLSTSLESVSIVKAITGMANSMGMETTAEGVETERQLEIVSGYGCTEVQGYLISRPVSADLLPALFERYGGGASIETPSSGDAELWLAVG